MRANPAHLSQSRPAAGTQRAAHRLLSVSIALATALILTACGDSTPASAPTTTTAPPDPNRLPANLHWEPFQGVQLPVGPDGPTKLATTATGYSHTPQGAALAAINHNVRLSLAPDTTWPQIASQSLIPGPAKDNWVLSRSQISITAPANPALAPKITAYKITAYSPDRTDLTIYSTYPDNSITSALQTVLWSAEDWRLLLPNPTAKVPTVASIPSIPQDALILPVVN